MLCEITRQQVEYSDQCHLCSSCEQVCGNCKLAIITCKSCSYYDCLDDDDGQKKWFCVLDIGDRPCKYFSIKD